MFRVARLLFPISVELISPGGITLFIFQRNSINLPGLPFEDFFADFSEPVRGNHRTEGHSNLAFSEESAKTPEFLMVSSSSFL